MLTIETHAKVNLYLDVLARNPDGFHAIETVMQSVSLSDELELSEAEAIHLRSEAPAPRGNDNLCVGAVQALRERYAVKQGARIVLKKRIPIAAGLGGGSADAAGTLLGAAELWRLRTAPQDLLEVGRAVGSDVPFALTGGTQLARGRGERLTRLPGIPDCWIVIATPPVMLSTRAVYEEYDRLRLSPLGGLEPVLEAIEGGDLRALGASLRNGLERATVSIEPRVASLREFLAAESLGASMSGSGPSVFAVLEEQDGAERLAGEVKRRFPGTFATVARPLQEGASIQRVRAARRERMQVTKGRAPASGRPQ